MKAIIAFITLSISISTSFGQSLIPLVSDIPSSFRGLDTYGKNVVWVSGSKGTVGYSKDKGKNWHWVNPKGYEQSDFRDIQVFSDREVIIMAVGSPGLILRTTDAGKTWHEVLRDDRPQIFLDAIAFDGAIGYALGDPIDGLFQLFKSTDKGKSWKDVTNQMVLLADEGEAAFAASGSSIQLKKDILFIGTGGKYASFFAYNPKKLRVDKYDVPIWTGEPSTGVFAIAMWDTKYGIAVGGNYESDRDNRNNILITQDGGITWNKPQTAVAGYRSDVLFLNRSVVISTGTSGTDLSIDAGENWKNISKFSFNTIAKSSDNKIIYLTGSQGNVYQLIVN